MQIIKIIFIALALMPTLSNATLEEELNWLQAEAIVFSVSRTEQRVLDTAAAVFVLNQQEIKRSGVTSVPEALRLVPGLQVAKINANVWAISSRGFNNAAANKLLVMIDGRTVYHPVLSGTLWRTKDVMLEDVERIEVIRGSGAAMWGSNAVNGVINVITKKAKDTQGVLITAGGGTEEQAFTSLRYGGNLNGNIDYRAYFKYAKHDGMKAISVADGNDEWENFQGGFRVDSELSNKDQLTLQGDIYQGNAGSFQQTIAPVAPTNLTANIKDDFSGGNVLGKWTHSISPTAAYSLQLYFDQTTDKKTYSSINDALETTVRTYDIDFQNHFQLLSWQNVTWGLGVRHMASKTEGSVNFNFSTVNRDFTLYSAFIQDEFILLPDRLKFIIGSKFEHNDFSGFEFQPNARLVFTPDNKQTIWAAVSRAVRIPNRLDHDLKLLYLSQVAPGVFSTGIGNSDLDSEELIAYEIGYRIQPTDTLLFDIAAFYNDYDKMVTAESNKTVILQTSPSIHGTIPIFPDNQGSAETYGVELLAQWQVFDEWRLQGSYSYLQIQFHSGNLTINPDQAEGNSPHHQYTLRSSVDLFKNVQFDTTVRYVDNLSSQDVESYTELDLRLAWTPLKNLELSIVGQNLLDSNHAEFGGTFTSTSMEVERSFYGKLSWSY